MSDKETLNRLLGQGRPVEEGYNIAGNRLFTKLRGKTGTPNAEIAAHMMELLNKSMVREHHTQGK